MLIQKFEYLSFKGCLQHATEYPKSFCFTTYNQPNLEVGKQDTQWNWKQEEKQDKNNVQVH